MRKVEKERKKRRKKDKETEKAKRADYTITTYIMTIDLSGRVALVTGGGSGIGFAFVQQIHAAGAKVLIADLALRPETQAWIDGLSETDRVRIAFQKTDVTRWDQLDDAFAACIDSGRLGFGVPTIVVPSAGVFEPNGMTFWQDTDKDDHYKILDINLTHPIKVTRIAVRHLIAAGIAGEHAASSKSSSSTAAAAILFVSSVAAQRASFVTPLYQASKHGINSFVRSMAPLYDLVGIKTGAVQPGTVRTPLYTDHPGALKLLDPTKDVLVDPERVADALFALLTDAFADSTNTYTSGTVLEVCHPEPRTSWRQVQLLNDPGPQGPAASASRKAEAVAGIMPYLLGTDAVPATFASVKTD